MTDASGKGGGCATKDIAWLRKFTCRERKLPICVLEAKIVLEAFTHNGPQWEGKVVPVYVDNTTALQCFRKGRSSFAKLNMVVRETFLVCAMHEITPIFFFVPTRMNALADALSRGDIEG